MKTQERLKNVREALNLNQSQIAKRLGITRGHWSNLEAGRAEPNELLAIAIEALFGVSKEWLLSGMGAMYLQQTPSEISREVPPEPNSKQMILDAVREAAATDERGKLIVAYLEELLDIARSNNSRRAAPEQPRPYRMTAEPTRETIEMQLNIPEAPPDLTPDDKARWERNADALRRWSETDSARRDFGRRGVPAWALERFCREVCSFFRGGNLEDVGGVLKNFIEEGKSKI